MYRPYSSGSSVPSQPPDSKLLIRDLNQDFCTAFNTGNYDQAAQIFAPDGALLAPHQPATLGQKQIERALRTFGEAGYENLRMETIRVDQSGDMASEIGRYTVTIREQGGNSVATTKDQGKYLKVWRRLGAWRIVADSWSSDLANVQDASRSVNSLPESPKPVIISRDVPKSA